MVATRILLVDDYKLWRSTVRSILEDTGKFQIIAEASHGKEAIEKATTLQPDVVLLDIGLPKINGIEAAKQIRHTCPESKIVYLTQEQDRDIRNAALATGAAAYVVKSRAACELRRAIETAMVNRNASRHHSEHAKLEPALLPLEVELGHFATLHQTDPDDSLCSGQDNNRRNL